MLAAPGPPTPRNWRQTQASAVMVGVTASSRLIACQAAVLAPVGDLSSQASVPRLTVAGSGMPTDLAPTSGP